MIIEMTALQSAKFLRREYYYNSAREGMLDLFQNMLSEGMIHTILLPAYIGWSAKEGSGIFDPLKGLAGVNLQYYKMTPDLSIDLDDLSDRMAALDEGKFAVLVVNYFGFIDARIHEVACAIREHSGWIVEDNAHGFFTYEYADETFSDATFFSLHKMFPFEHGGSLVVHTEPLSALTYHGQYPGPTEYNPWQYDVPGIARARCENYRKLESIVSARGISEFFVPLKPEGLPEGIVPQTFPIRVVRGDRDAIYRLMNESGYGVVSLYHTLIEPLRHPDYEASNGLSRCIMNLPVHQDVDSDRYGDMVKLLAELCNVTGRQ
ncbi:MAG: hypothetical protein Q7J82_01690 [Coriobacteriia bacterium]|nr:hypothetical protein [Coriobacteriia bacterium]